MTQLKLIHDCMDCHKPFAFLQVTKRPRRCPPCGATRTMHMTHVRNYRLAPDEYERRFAAQGRACAICGTTTSGQRNFHIDHDRSCCAGARSCGTCVRGILCNLCNLGLGCFTDSPKKLAAAVAYLDAWTES